MTSLYKGTGGHNYIEDEDVENTTNKIEKMTFAGTIYGVSLFVDTKDEILTKQIGKYLLDASEALVKQNNPTHQNHIEEIVERIADVLYPRRHETTGEKQFVNIFALEMIRSAFTTYGDQRAEEVVERGYKFYRDYCNKYEGCGMADSELALKELLEALTPPQEPRGINK